MNGWRERRGAAHGQAGGIDLTVTVRRWEEIKDDVRTLPAPDDDDNPRTLLLRDHDAMPDDPDRPGFRIEGRRNGRRALSAFLTAPEAAADRQVTIRLFTGNISPEQFLESYNRRRQALSQQLEDQLKAFIRLMGPRPEQEPAWQLSEDGKSAHASLNRLTLTVLRRNHADAAAGVERVKNNSIDIRNTVEAGRPERIRQDGDVLTLNLSLGGMTVCMAVIDGDEEINGADSNSADSADVPAYTRAHTPRAVLGWLVQLTTTRTNEP